MRLEGGGVRYQGAGRIVQSRMGMRLQLIRTLAELMANRVNPLNRSKPQPVQSTEIWFSETSITDSTEDQHQA